MTTMDEAEERLPCQLLNLSIICVSCQFPKGVSIILVFCDVLMKVDKDGLIKFLVLTLCLQVVLSNCKVPQI